MQYEDADPFFTSLCSSKTLQSNERGFFAEFADHVTEEAGSDWLEHHFAKLASDKARINACFSDAKVGPVVRDTLSNVREVYRPKDTSVARQRLDAGDAAWTDGDLRRALHMYSQSVLRAPLQGVATSVDAGGCSLAEALACRSETLHALGRQELSIADMQLAIKEGYPHDQRYRLYRRMGECYRDMGVLARAKLCFQLAAKLVKDDPNHTNPAQVVADIEEEIDNLNRVQPAEYKSDDIKTSLPALTDGCNPSFPHASRRVGVTKTAGAGRFAVAAANVNAGDVLVAEPAYAACLLADCAGTHCHHCFNRLEAPVGCGTCSSVAFCSVACRDAALDSYHRHECRFMDLMVGSGMSALCHLALRMVTQTPLARFLALRSSLNTHTEDITTQDKYLSIYNLVTHAERRPPEEFLHRTLMAAFLLKCLQRSKYFPNPTKDSQGKLSKDELFIGSLLLRHLQLLQFNAHEVHETILAEPKSIRGSKSISVGIAVYPTVSLFNHDCYPGVARHFIGSSIVIKALRPLAVGEVIAENYGPIFTKRSLALRQRTLASRYWFKCGCRPCSEDWPVMEKLSNALFRFRCPTAGCTHPFPRPPLPPNDKKKSNSKVKCVACKKQVSLDESLLSFCHNEIYYADGQDLMEAGEIEKAAAKYCAYLDAMHSLGSPPFKDLHVCELALRCCFALEGNTWVATNAVRGTSMNPAAVKLR